MLAGLAHSQAHEGEVFSAALQVSGGLPAIIGLWPVDTFLQQNSGPPGWRKSSKHPDWCHSNIQCSRVTDRILKSCSGSLLPQCILPHILHYWLIIDHSSSGSHLLHGEEEKDRRGENVSWFWVLSPTPTPHLPSLAFLMFTATVLTTAGSLVLHPYLLCICWSFPKKQNNQSTQNPTQIGCLKQQKLILS